MSVGAGALTPLEQVRTSRRKGGAMAHEEPERFGGHLDSMEANLCEGEPLLSEEVRPCSGIAVAYSDKQFHPDLPKTYGVKLITFYLYTFPT